MEQTITAKIQIVTTDEQKELLNQTLLRYRDACNYVSEYVFKNFNSKLNGLQAKTLQPILYDQIRSQFGLGSQMTCSLFRTVIAKYKTNKSLAQNKKISKTYSKKSKKKKTYDNGFVLVKFKKPQIDLVWNRDYSLFRKENNHGTNYYS